MQRTFIRLLEACLFSVKMFVLRRLKKSPDPVLFDVPVMIELVNLFQTTMGPFNLAKVPKLLEQLTCKAVANLCLNVWCFATRPRCIVSDEICFVLYHCLVKFLLFCYLLLPVWKENLFPVQHQTLKPVLNETLNIDTNLLGELLTLQGVFQDSNCNLGSSFVGK